MTLPERDTYQTAIQMYKTIQCAWIS